MEGEEGGEGEADCWEDGVTLNLNKSRWRRGLSVH